MNTTTIVNNTAVRPEFPMYYLSRSRGEYVSGHAPAPVSPVAFLPNPFVR
jgi:hypothetical protein